jgi:hypothetical protein
MAWHDGIPQLVGDRYVEASTLDRGEHRLDVTEVFSGSFDLACPCRSPTSALNRPTGAGIAFPIQAPRNKQRPFGQNLFNISLQLSRESIEIGRNRRK